MDVFYCFAFFSFVLLGQHAIIFLLENLDI